MDEYLYCGKCVKPFPLIGIVGQCPNCKKWSSEKIYVKNINELDDERKQHLCENTIGKVRCPHCLNESDSSYYELDNEESEEIECSNCNKDFIVTMEIEVHYSTKKSEEEGVNSVS